jgi:hypothetical protein
MAEWTALILSRQARQELNPQPPVLETGALPIELLACVGHPAKKRWELYRLDGPFNPLLRFLVDGMFAAARAVFLDLHPVGIVPSVFFRCVVPLLAITASKSDHGANVLLF